MEKIKQNSPTSIDYISSETARKAGDSRVSDAVRKVPGVSTVGSFVSVRGLADRYIKTTVNGSRIPTLDPFTNNFRLDIFPVGLIDNLINDYFLRQVVDFFPHPERIKFIKFILH